jgi:hypothetical protein
VIPKPISSIAAQKNRGERPPSQGVVLGRKRSAALDDGATGGMSAIILRAHIIAAAKVRRQSLKIKSCELPAKRKLKLSDETTVSAR